jgi:hypothetical protein
MKNPADRAHHKLPSGWWILPACVLGLCGWLAVAGFTLSSLI